MVFLHGTTIGGQVGIEAPIGDPAIKLQAWSKQGAEIVYLTHCRKTEDVEKQKLILTRHGFPEGPVFYRRKDEEYADVAERVLPDMIVEDDCASIGGEREMTYPHLKPETKMRIRSIVVEEGHGIDHLPNNLTQLMNC